MSAGRGEAEHRAGGQGPKCRKDFGHQPGGAGACGGRGPTRHRGFGCQNMRPERPEAKPGEAHRRVAAGAAAAAATISTGSAPVA